METTRQNGELAEALQKKDLELERHIENIAEQDHTIEQRDAIIKMLSDKEEEHTNIIKLLRNNLEMRSQADDEVSNNKFPNYANLFDEIYLVLAFNASLL